MRLAGGPMQYSRDFTEALQLMWGEGFLSPGGPQEVADMLQGIEVRGKRILDIGSGLGGVDLVLAEQHGAREVVGIDVEEELVEVARDLVQRRGHADRVRFELVEPGVLPFIDGAFDLVFSKDALVHVEDKALTYREALRVLKPGGVFVAADWLWAEGVEVSPVVQAWLSRGPLKFAFTTPDEATRALRDAGFDAVKVVDKRLALQSSNREEIKALEGDAGRRMAERLGDDMAARRLYSAKGRQRALDSGDLVPSHLYGWKAEL
jgi:ubiquinone/menaquinone biosynthesis C-methylase UbiE